MQDTYTTPTSEDIPSKAAVARHPIHPMVIIFPIASFVFALLTDILYLVTTDEFWARSSLYLIMAGVVTGAVAGAVGAIDYLTIPPVRSIRAATFHGLGNVIVLVLGIVNLMARVNDFVEGLRSPGIILSVVIGLLLLGTGWLGGELVYRHKVGIDSRGVDQH